MDSWYTRYDVQYEVIRFLQNREFACLVPSCFKAMNMAKRSTRNFRCHNAQSISYILNNILKYRERQTVLNTYYSMATFVSGVPRMSPALDQRSTQCGQWNGISSSKVNSFDWLIDIDAGSFEELDEAHKSAVMVSDFLDKFSVPYELRFSGMGFHFIVPHKYFISLKLSLDPFASLNLYQLLNSLGKALHNKFSEMIDYNINDHRRLCKLPYSIAFYDEKALVCWPFLSKKEFLDFNIDDYDVTIHNESLRGRGTQVFNHCYNDYDPRKFIYELLGGSK